MVLAGSLLLTGCRTFKAGVPEPECQANLKAFYRAHVDWHLEYDARSTSVKALGFRPARGNRYAYFGMPDDRLVERSGPDEVVEAQDTGVGVDHVRYPDHAPVTVADVLPFVRPGLVGECPACEVTLVCAGRFDDLVGLDLRSISTAARLIDGREVPAGVVHRHEEASRAHAR